MEFIMREYEFALVVSSDTQVSGELICKYADMLFEAGAEDCTVSSKGNVLVVDFDREATSYEEAVVSAIKQVNSVDGLTVKSVDAGQFVGLSDAAELSQLTRSALSKFSKGERGDGTFPTPYLRVQGKAPLYDWSEIAQWLESKGLVEQGIADNAKITAQLNMALKLKNGELENVSRLASML